MIKRKYILLLFCVLFFSLSSFAGNILQQKDEINFLKKTNAQYQSSNYNSIYLIMEDYHGYLQGRNAFYGYIVNGIKDVDKFPNKNLNLKYLKLIKDKIDFVISNNSNTRSSDFLFAKIIIDDTDYQHLSEDTKMIIHMYNYIAGNR